MFIGYWHILFFKYSDKTFNSTYLYFLRFRVLYIKLKDDGTFNYAYMDRLEENKDKIFSLFGLKFERNIKL